MGMRLVWSRSQDNLCLNFETKIKKILFIYLYFVSILDDMYLKKKKKTYFKLICCTQKDIVLPNRIVNCNKVFRIILLICEKKK